MSSCTAKSPSKAAAPRSSTTTSWSANSISGYRVARSAPAAAIRTARRAVKSGRAFAEDAAFAARTAAHEDPVETGQLIVQPVPDPAADILERRHFEPLDVVEIAMVELMTELDDMPFELTEIAQPMLLLVFLALQEHLDPEGVAVQPSIRMAVGDIDRQVMCCLEGKFFKDFKHICLCAQRGAHAHLAK